MCIHPRTRRQRVRIMPGLLWKLDLHVQARWPQTSMSTADGHLVPIFVFNDKTHVYTGCTGVSVSKTPATKLEKGQTTAIVTGAVSVIFGVGCVSRNIFILYWCPCAAHQRGLNRCLCGFCSCIHESRLFPILCGIAAGAVPAPRSAAGQPW
jgi:hypothetical protein